MFGSSSESVPEAEYSGEVTTVVQTNGEGEAKIEANLNSQGDEYDLTIDVKTTDEDGNSLSDVQVQYGQFNGKSFMMVGSPQGNYLPQVFFGTPEEMIKYFSGSIETNSKSSATKKESAAAVTVAATATIGMIALTKASIDIIEGAYKTEKFYITDQVERGEDYIAYCKTFSEVAELIDARVGTSLAGTSIAVNFLTLGAGGVSGGALEGSSLALDVGMLGVERMRDALLERAVESWGEEADAINDERPVEVRVYFSEGDGAGTKIENFYARFDVIRNSPKCESGSENVYSEDFSSDPEYEVHYQNTDEETEVYWDDSGENYYARVRDQAETWWALGKSPAFTTISSGDPFSVSFNFNPVEPDWGHYPGISFVESNPSSNPRELSRSFTFQIRSSDNYDRELSITNSDGDRYSTPTIPAEDEWYEVTVEYNPDSETIDLSVLREDGSAFVNETGIPIPIYNSFDQIMIGETQGDGIQYGNQAQIRVDDIEINAGSD
jgi:hypothetical protein